MIETLFFERIGWQTRTIKQKIRDLMVGAEDYWKTDRHFQPDRTQPPKLNHESLEFKDEVDLQQVESGTVIGLMPFKQERSDEGKVVFTTHPDSVFTLLIAGGQGRQRQVIIWRSSIDQFLEDENRSNITGQSLRVNLEVFLKTCRFNDEKRDSSLFAPGDSLLMPYFLEGRGHKGGLKIDWQDARISKIGSILVGKKEN